MKAEELKEVLANVPDDKEDKFPIINWQQVRVDAAIAAMPLVYNLMDGVCCTHPEYPNQMRRAEIFAKECVGFADVLIKELKK